MLPGERRRLKGTQDLVNSAPETGILWLPLTFRGPLCKTHGKLVKGLWGLSVLPSNAPKSKMILKWVGAVLYFCCVTH